MRALAIAIVAGVLGVGRVAAADPVPPPRVIHVPTARILPRGTLHALAGANRRQGGALIVTHGLADLAEVELGTTDDFLACDPCTGERAADHLWPLVAGFKLGVNQGQWFRAQPGLALGLRTTAGGRAPAWTPDPAKLAELYGVVSAAVGAGLSLHAGAALWAARSHDPDGGVVTLAASPRTVRPFAGFEYTPSFYPRTTLVGDVTFVPELAPRGIQLRWVGGWGVRYQAFSWSGIELEVRHRQGDGLGGSTVMVRLTGALRVWD